MKTLTIMIVMMVVTLVAAFALAQGLLIIHHSIIRY